MSSERDAERAAAPAPAPPQPAMQASVPAAPVPLPAAPEIGTLVVGHAEDRAEADADRQADAALARLRRLEPTAPGVDAHQHGPGCDHLRRSPAASSGAPVVGYEGGSLDAGTSAAIEGRRGAGRPLEEGVRRRMETAFGASFSGVRVHADDTAARLNSAVSARAFTTGKDVFFGKGQYAPGTDSGDRVLAHELAHTLQPGGSAHRLMAAPVVGVSPRAHAAIVRSVATTAHVQRWPWSKKEKPAYEGPGGKMPSNLEERGKAGVVATVVGGAQVAATATAKTASAASAAAPLGAGVGSAAGLLTTADALTGLNNARKMDNDAETYGDAGMGNLAGRKGKNQGMQALGGAISTAKGGVEMGYLASAGKTGVQSALKSGLGDAALGTAAGGLGVAVGSVQTLQGLWKSGKAVQKLCRLAWGRSKNMYSVKGNEKWKPAVLSAERFKLGVGVVKTALGVLGIAAGALLIVSNPIGWGIGLAAAIAGGVYAATKIVAKIKDARERTAIAQKIADQADPVGAVGVDTAQGRIEANAKKSTERAAKKNDKAGKGKDVGEDELARIKAIEKANEVARQASDVAVVASEMRERMLWADDVGHEGVWTALQNEVDEGTQHGAGLRLETHKELYDAYMLLSTINVTREEAVSASGQELIEKKLSKMESM